MHRLEWEVDELQHLLLECQGILRQFEELKHKINVPLADLRARMRKFVKGIIRFRRTPASHIAVFMISDEERRRKPYAVPIQCVPYRGLTEVLGRKLVKAIVAEMHRRGMYVSGKMSQV